MKIRNLSRYDTPSIRAVIQYIKSAMFRKVRNIKAVEVRNSRHVGSGLAGYIVSLRLGPPEKFPSHDHTHIPTRSGGYMGWPACQDWLEGLAFLTGHEFAHRECRQEHAKGLAEGWCDLQGRKALELFRGHREEVLQKALHLQTRQDTILKNRLARTTERRLPEAKLQKFQGKLDVLVRQQKRLDNRVKKLRCKTRRYERNLAARKAETCQIDVRSSPVTVSDVTAPAN